MKSAREKFIDFLRHRGLSFTAERRRILEAVFSLHRHFDFDDLYDVLRSRKGRVSRATIYRTLPLLMESGLIRQVFSCRERPHFEHTYGHEHHDHMVCIGCGRYIEFKDNRIEKAQKEICERYGFFPVDHRLGIRGYCRKCAAKSGASRRRRESRRAM